MAVLLGEAGIGSGLAGTSATTAGARQTTKLIRQGFKLAVLGCEEPSPERPNTLRWWHIVRPGSYNVPALGERLTYGRSLCRKTVVSNGYAADWRPPEGQLCPACNEQL